MLRSPSRPALVAEAAAPHLVDYDWKVWGFGESIGLRALLELDEHQLGTGFTARATDYLEFVQGLVRPWCERLDAAGFKDHVAPGSVLIDLYMEDDEEVYMDAAVKLAALQGSFPVERGVAVHRPDLDGLSSLIWVDCMALDGPFLAALGALTQSDALQRRAVDFMLSYADALLDPAAGLFRHGFDTATGRQSSCNWARGNGWALHGLIDTLAELDEGFAGRSRLLELLQAQAAALIALQDDSGLWHTILDDPDSPLENSTAAFFVSGLMCARRYDYLPASGPLDDCIKAGLEVLYSAVGADGALQVSYATPVGPRETYVNAPTGVFPWGQGPLILAMLEATRA